KSDHHRNHNSAARNGTGPLHNGRVETDLLAIHRCSRVGHIIPLTPLKRLDGILCGPQARVKGFAKYLDRLDLFSRADQPLHLGDLLSTPAEFPRRRKTAVVLKEHLARHYDACTAISAFLERRSFKFKRRRTRCTIEKFRHTIRIYSKAALFAKRQIMMTPAR